MRSAVALARFHDRQHALGDGQVLARDAQALGGVEPQEIVVAPRP
ncbi:hypothetical protein ACFJGX_14535 [Hydrogenophaga sp. UC242_50]